METASSLEVFQCLFLVHMIFYQILQQTVFYYSSMIPSTLCLVSPEFFTIERFFTIQRLLFGDSTVLNGSILQLELHIASCTFHYNLKVMCTNSAWLQLIDVLSCNCYIQHSAARLSIWQSSFQCTSPWQTIQPKSKAEKTIPPCLMVVWARYG